jgi:hypothetical protein
MIDEYNVITLILGTFLSCWTAYLHYKMNTLCNSCMYDYTPKKKEKEKVNAVTLD